MSLSQIIKNLVMGKQDLLIALKFLKVILYKYDDPKIFSVLSWIEHEITGYELADENDYPDYRRIDGRIRGTYFSGKASYENVYMPISHIAPHKLRPLCYLTIPQGVSTLSLLAKNKGVYISRTLSPDNFQLFQTGTGISSIISLETASGDTICQDILSALESRLLGIFLLLEKQLGNLDALGLCE